MAMTGKSRAPVVGRVEVVAVRPELRHDGVVEDADPDEEGDAEVGHAERPASQNISRLTTKNNVTPTTSVRRDTRAASQLYAGTNAIRTSACSPEA